mgnify:CR=1 FL=1
MANQPLVGIIMGSDSDLNIMQAAADILKTFNISFELTVVSAHRTPERMVNYAKQAKARGLKVIIAGAGGAAGAGAAVAAGFAGRDARSGRARPAARAAAPGAGSRA